VLGHGRPRHTKLALDLSHRLLDETRRPKIARRFGSAMTSNTDSTLFVYSIEHIRVKGCLVQTHGADGHHRNLPTGLHRSSQQLLLFAAVDRLLAIEVARGRAGADAQDRCDGHGSWDGRIGEPDNDRRRRLRFSYSLRESSGLHSGCAKIRADDDHFRRHASVPHKIRRTGIAGGFQPLSICRFCGAGIVQPWSFGSGQDAKRVNLAGVFRRSDIEQMGMGVLEKKELFSVFLS